MTGYSIAFVVGFAAVVTTRFVMRRELRRAMRENADPRIGRVAVSLFLQVVGVGVLLAGFFGVLHEARGGQRPPVPVGVLLGVMGIGVVALLVPRGRRPMRLRSARPDRSRRQ